ncbi:hypothetical protein [Cohnella silvisoli]|uniref:Uncharacterized protein n=1 Tax=Cohnella silvisoli TaxID=2873699 RepID=A0ABV1KSI5_9BACL|nr:hypothetical protein [Cohnella silvisoli]
MMARTLRASRANDKPFELELCLPGALSRLLKQLISFKLSA